MEGSIRTTYCTYQVDMFSSGLVAEIGSTAFLVWCAIKAHANFEAGVCWPGIRRLMKVTGLASATVQRALTVLESAHLLRSWVKGQRRYYIARERLDVNYGNRTLCSIIVDYVPNTIRKKLVQIESTLQAGEDNPQAFVGVEIIPGAGFSWDGKSGVLKAAIPVAESPSCKRRLTDETTALVRRVNEIRLRANGRDSHVPK